jgi:hypothetical protein
MRANEENPGRAAVRMLLSAAFAALLLVAPVHAQDAKPATKPAPSATARSKANVLTRDELRACMNEQDRLQAIRTKIEQEQVGLDKAKAQIQAMDAELQKKVAALDPADEAARKALEGEGARRDQAADDYNARLAGLREQATLYDTGRKGWVEKCAARDFDEMDEAAIKKERQQAARANSKK